MASFAVCERVLSHSNRSLTVNGFTRGLSSCSRLLAALESSNSAGKSTKQSYPLYPSVAQLLHQKGISIADVDNIPATGPKGRLLKGDVLAHLGTISSSYSSDQSARISKLGLLDLSNIQPATPKKIEPPAPAKPTAEALELNRILANELFNQILGIESKKPKPSAPNLTPQLTPSPTPAPIPQIAARPIKERDIIDILIAKNPPASSI